MQYACQSIIIELAMRTFQFTSGWTDAQITDSIMVTIQRNLCPEPDQLYVLICIIRSKHCDVSSIGLSQDDLLGVLISSKHICAYNKYVYLRAKYVIKATTLNVRV